MLKPNPNYGHGTFRRRVQLNVAPGQVNVDLEDSNHAFRLVLRHDGERITTIEPEVVRHPFTTCPEAVRSLRVLIGRPLDGTLDLRRELETRAGCTHLTDMVQLAVAHMRDVGLRRLYDIAVDDEREGLTHARIACDDHAVHDWVIVRHTMVEPGVHAGRPLMKGFHGWAMAAFAGLEFEAATMLQRGYFVAQSRRFVSEPAREHPAGADGLPDGVCHSYSTPAVQRAQRIDGSKRDFTNDADALLRFKR